MTRLRPATLAAMRRRLKGFLKDRVSIARRTGEVDFSGVPRDNVYADVAGLDAVPCRIIGKAPSAAVTPEMTDLSVAELSALFETDTNLEVGDRLTIDGRVYRVRGLQDDMTDLIFKSADIERLRDE